MEKEKREKVLMGIVFLLMFTLGSIVLGFGDTDRTDGIIKGDEPLGIGLIVGSICLPYVISLIWGVFKK